MKQYSLVGQKSGSFVRHADYIENQELEIGNDISVPILGYGDLPPPTQNYYKQFWIGPGGGSQTILYICLKDTAGDYYWEQVSAGLPPIATMLRASPTDPVSDRVLVAGGFYRKSDGSSTIQYTGGTSPTFQPIVSNSRIDLLVIDDSGTLDIIQGIENISPVAPEYPSNKYTIAEITITELSSVIIDLVDINDCRDLLGPPRLNIDGLSDGATYGRVLTSELSGGNVRQINDGVHVADAEEVRDHIDNSSIHITQHNSLSDIQGGLVGERYHLDNSEHTEATQYATNSQSGLMTSTDHGYLPTGDEKDALSGTDGVPSNLNKYVTNSDSRLNDDRYPTSHASSHENGGSDEISTATPSADSIPKSNALGNLNDWITSIDAASITSPGVQIKLMSGTRAEIDAGSLDLGEVALATDTKEIFIGNGSGKQIAGNLLIDVFSNRPVFGTPSRFFYATDTGGLYLDAGTSWVPLVRSADIKTEYVDFKLDGTGTIGTYRTKSFSGGVTQEFTIEIPMDFVSLVSLELMLLVTSDSSSSTVALSSNYASPGENYLTHTESLTNQSASFTGNIITPFSLAGVLSNVSAGDVVGIGLNLGIGKTFHGFFIRLGYIASI